MCASKPQGKTTKTNLYRLHRCNIHLISYWNHISKSRCSRNPPDWLTHMMHWPSLLWVSLQALQEGYKHHMPETKMWPLSRRMHYFKVLCARGTAYSTVYLHILASAKRNTNVANDKYRRLQTDTDSTLATQASLKLPWSLAKQCWQTSLAVKYQTASTLVSDGACSRLEFEKRFCSKRVLAHVVCM